jgi:hypothetical protein
MRKQALWALAAAAFFAAAPVALAQLPGRIQTPLLQEEGVEVQAVGHVQSVGNGFFTLVVRDMTFRVTHRGNVGAVGRIDDRNLRVGDRVRVIGNLADRERIQAEQLQILQRGRPGRQPNTVAGTIRRIERNQNLLVVDTNDGNFRVTWNENTEFVRNSTRSGPAEFRVGDPVRVVGRRDGVGQMIARRVMFGGRPGWTNNSVGEIIGIDGRERELDVDFEGEVWTVRLTNAQIRRVGRRLDINDLRIGQDIRVAGTARGGRTVDASTVDVLREADR